MISKSCKQLNSIFKSTNTISRGWNSIWVTIGLIWFSSGWIWFIKCKHDFTIEQFWKYFHILPIIYTTPLFTTEHTTTPLSIPFSTVRDGCNMKYSHLIQPANTCINPSDKHKTGTYQQFCPFRLLVSSSLPALSWYWMRMLAPSRTEGRPHPTSEYLEQGSRFKSPSSRNAD